MASQATTLKVKEAPRTEVGQGLARIDPDVFDELGIAPGDAILIEGSKKAAGLAWRAGEEDRGHGIVRLDGILRHNAGAGVDEDATITPADCKDAAEIKLAPSQPIDYADDFVAYVHQRIMNMPLLAGNSVILDVMGTTLALAVTAIKPKGIVRIVPGTRVHISKKPVKIKDVAGVIHYEDIGGLKAEIEAIREMIETPLRHPEVFKHLGIKPPKGVMLYGPPGTGKTLLAKAVANETDSHFINLASPEVVSKFYGQSEENLRDLFKQAQENAPAIIFIDEIDAIAPAREETHGELEKRLVSQLLTLMDGLEARGEVVVITATNRPDSVDPALRRPGRFDREIQIGVPDRQGRLEILQIHTRGMPLSPDVNLERLADVTYGYTGADLENLAKEAAMRALKKLMPEIKKSKAEKLSLDVLKNVKVTGEDFQNAMSKIEPSAMREVMVEVPRVSWEDIGGLAGVKQKLRETVEWPLNYPHLFTETGVAAPKGVMLYGPPGCGKTLLAKAVANEAGANFIAVKGPELISKWVGESERGVRKVFSRARQVAPTIIFFDEIDALASGRGADTGTNVTERVIAQLLTEIDGVAELKNVTVVASTNRPDLVDDALMRPGRLDRLVYVPFPDREARKSILEVHVRDMALAGDLDLDALVAKTENYTGADLAALCREAGMNAIRNAVSLEASKNGKPKAEKVSGKDFEHALSIVTPSISEARRSRWEVLRKEVGERG